MILNELPYIIILFKPCWFVYLFIYLIVFPHKKDGPDFCCLDLYAQL